MTRTVVITGASAGIGRALALEYARRAWRLGLASRRRDALETLRGELDAMTAGRAPPAAVAELDVADPATAVPRLHALFEALGGVDVFIANAGVNEIGRAHVLTPVTPISRMPSSA